MKKLSEIYEWIADKVNETNPLFSRIMIEINLINTLKLNMHEHNSVDAMRKFWVSCDMGNKIYIAKSTAQTLGIPITLAIGEGMDPGDTFFKNMLAALKLMIKQKKGPDGFSLGPEDEILCEYDVKIQRKINTSIAYINEMLSGGPASSAREMEVRDMLANIKHDCLMMFEQSIGFEFRLKGQILTDICDGVDWDTMMVKGRKYGNFAVELCELTGKTYTEKNKNASLN
jgi:hypothetical protein